MIGARKAGLLKPSRRLFLAAAPAIILPRLARAQFTYPFAFGGAGAAPTNFALDNFASETTDGQTLTGNNDQLGNAWATGNGSANSLVIGTTVSPHGFFSIQSFTDTFNRNPGSPPGADYTVQCDIFFNSATNGAAGVLGRMASGAQTFYMAIANGFGPYWQIQRCVTGTFTSLGTSSQTFATSTTYLSLQLKMSGSAISLSVNGTTLISVNDPVASGGISAAGFSGIYANSPGNETAALGQNFKAFH